VRITAAVGVFEDYRTNDSDHPYALNERIALLASIENHFRLARHPPQNRRAPSESTAKEEFQRLIKELREPIRTMVIIAM
jgi:hypothetical protein